jgi:hypothetical protein
LVADFDRDWPDVKRSREILVLAEEWGAPYASLSATGISPYVHQLAD